MDTITKKREGAFMLTELELYSVLGKYYTSEELVDMLNITPEELLFAFCDKIDDCFDELVEHIGEEVGYYEEEETDLWQE